MSDKIKLISELESLVTTLDPEINVTKLRIRAEEVIDKYSVASRTFSDLQNDLSDNIRLFISSKRIEGLSDITLGGYAQELALFNDFIQRPTVNVSTSDIRRYIASNDALKQSTNSKKLSVLKSFFAWLVDEEVITRNPTSKIRTLKQSKRLPKALTSGELEAVRDGCISLRERALVEVLYSTGCRLSEIINVKTDDVDWTTGSTKVIGKGDKERVVYLNAKAQYHLRKYLEEKRHNEDYCEYLFTTQRRPYRQLRNKSVQDIVEKIGKRAGLSTKLHPHKFRHTMATLAIDKGIELGDLQQLLGHSSSNTTLRYVTVSEERKHSAHKRFII